MSHALPLLASNTFIVHEAPYQRTAGIQVWPEGWFHEAWNIQRMYEHILLSLPGRNRSFSFDGLSSLEVAAGDEPQAGPLHCYSERLEDFFSLCPSRLTGKG